jgi:hypothetical protein
LIVDRVVETVVDDEDIATAADEEAAGLGDGGGDGDTVLVELSDVDGMTLEGLELARLDAVVLVEVEEVVVEEVDGEVEEVEEELEELSVAAAAGTLDDDDVLGTSAGVVVVVGGGGDGVVE